MAEELVTGERDREEVPSGLCGSSFAMDSTLIPDGLG
jgi:hypothetical protein